MSDVDFRMPTPRIKISRRTITAVQPVSKATIFCDTVLMDLDLRFTRPAFHPGLLNIDPAPAEGALLRDRWCWVGPTP
jgi:hypothetical protein